MNGYIVEADIDSQNSSANGFGTLCVGIIYAHGVLVTCLWCVRVAGTPPYGRPSGERQLIHTNYFLWVHIFTS